ncbi:MAG: cupredoxin domain-containing protein [Candidatus Paceibacterota bacterium]
MSKNQSIVLVVVLILVALGVGYAVMNDSITLPQQGETDEGSEVNEGSVGEEVSPGSSLINEEGRIVNESGVETRNDAEINDEDAPKQSRPLEDDEVSTKAIRMTVSSEGFSPSTIEVDSDEAVIIALTVTDDQTHIFKFKDPSLQALAVGLGPGETREIPFNAPAKGEYDFYCDVPGHEGRGEVGTMIVN